MNFDEYLKFEVQLKSATYSTFENLTFILYFGSEKKRFDFVVITKGYCHLRFLSAFQLYLMNFEIGSLDCLEDSKRQGCLTYQSKQ